MYLIDRLQTGGRLAYLESFSLEKARDQFTLDFFIVHNQDSCAAVQSTGA
ncbi:MAG TPA: hypothetical protein VMW69_11900 [Spirochaetia bacterium]|nr:hypothetical protein [Spirochaetia bacterium]